MKKIFSYILLGGVFAFSSCEKKEVNYTPKDFAPAPVISAAVAAVEDSTVYVDITSAGVGKLYYALTIGEDETATPEAIIEGKVGSAIVSESTDISAEGTFTITISDLVQDTEYFLYSVSGSVDGSYQKEVTVTPVSTTDIHAPEVVFDSSNPVRGGTADISPIIQFVYDEPIVLSTDASIHLYGFILTGAQYTFGHDKFSVEGNVLSIDLSELPVVYGEAYLVTIPEGSISDASGNIASSIAWDHNGEGFTRLDYYFWTRDENTNEVMQDFIGVNNFIKISPSGTETEGQFDVQVLEGTESTVVLADYFGLKPVELEFSMNTTAILMKRTETGFYLYFNKEDADDPDNYTFHEGEPSKSTDWKLVYMPEDSYTLISGEYDRESGQFRYGTELVALGLGSFGVYQTYSEQVRILEEMMSPSLVVNKYSKEVTQGVIFNSIDNGMKLTFY